MVGRLHLHAEVLHGGVDALAHASFEAVERRDPLRPSSSAAIGTLGLDSGDPILSLEALTSSVHKRAVEVFSAHQAVHEARTF